MNTKDVYRQLLTKNEYNESLSLDFRIVKYFNDLDFSNKNSKIASKNSN